jgi:hypothetical protein
MRKIRDVLRLRLGENLSLRQTVLSLAMPLTTVADYVNRAKAAGVTWPLEDLDDDALEARLFRAPSATGSPYPQPDFEVVKREVSHKGVTLQLTWLEYRDLHPDGYGYSQFCHLYRTWRRHQSVVMRQDHKAAEKLFVDYPGMTIPIYDERTLEVSYRAELFVAVLGPPATPSPRRLAVSNYRTGSRRTWRPSSSSAACPRSSCPTICVPP